MKLGHHSLAQALAQHHGRFAHASTGLPGAVERDYFAHILLCRLLLIYDLQVAGWLAGGDRWYLHNQLGLQASATPSSFFKTFLQPLCHQGLSLPTSERPQSLSARIGDIPCLGSWLFAPHPLELQYPQVDLPDEPLEQFLGWLAEQVWQRDPPPPPLPLNAQQSEVATITRPALAAAWEALMTAPDSKPKFTPVAKLAAICQQTVDAHILQVLSAPAAEKPLSDWLSGITDEDCVQLITQVLPSLSILDPACGSGRFLLMALDRLQGIYQTCWDYAQQASHPQLQNWVRSLQSLPCSPQWAWTQQILTQNLYGVDVRSTAIAVTQTQLWLRLLSTAPSEAPLPLLPDLDFNIIAGNALIGFIRVDEESFDQIAPPRSQAETDKATVLQGNLLQPLAAANYRDTLAEKQIRIEHYRAQTHAMGAEGGIPEYVQREFLRDRIESVNAAVQQKLNGLLFETLSRQLGILVPEPQPSGRTRKRLLTPADMTALQPVHWGFAFNAILSQGGFDLIITQAPEGTLRPQAAEFYDRHRDRFEQLEISLSAFRRSRRQTLQQHPELATHWATYAGRINCLRDYVRRSPDYAPLGPLTTRRSIALKPLFAQRCQLLIKVGPIPPHIE
ncbi:MAG: SAM-dependent DNA methyltransferase [Leptolyngbya sp. SIOISBB]|nr:SAM-dependent DNA methyltransferase [Leptolyngbya sp. SIOISBB]